MCASEEYLLVYDFPPCLSALAVNSREIKVKKKREMRRGALAAPRFLLLLLPCSSKYMSVTGSMNEEKKEAVEEEAELRRGSKFLHNILSVSTCVCMPRSLRPVEEAARMPSSLS